MPVNIYATKYKVRYSRLMMIFFVVGFGSWSVLFFVGMLNNIALQRVVVAVICGLLSFAVFLITIRALRKEVVSMLFTDDGILVRRPFERIGIFKRKPRREFIPVGEIKDLRIELTWRMFTRFYIEKTNGTVTQLGFDPADSLWLSELKEFLELRKNPIVLKVKGPGVW